MELGPLRLRQRGVGDVADEDVVEAEAVPAPLHEALLIQRRQPSDLAAERP